MLNAKEESELPFLAVRVHPTPACVITVRFQDARARLAPLESFPILINRQSPQRLLNF